MQNQFSLSGLVAATHTPFHADGGLHLDAIEKQAAHLLSWNVHAVFIGGTTGESQSLTLDERLALARRWMDVTRGTPMQVIVHTGSNCLEDSAVLAADAQKIGAAAVSALAPSYFKPATVDLLVECCLRTAQAAPATPFYFYHIPPLTGVSFPAVEFLQRASSRIPNLAGLKFTAPDLMGCMQCLRQNDGQWNILWGFDEWLLGALAIGVRGGVGSSYNFAAPISQRLIAAFEKGDLTAARTEQWRSVQLIALVSKYGYMAAAKEIMAMLGVDVGKARLPHGSLEEAQVRNLRGDLETLGFFDWLR